MNPTRRVSQSDSHPRSVRPMRTELEPVRPVKTLLFAENHMQKVVVVTGASAGVGRATAREFAAQGCGVALLARNQGRLETIADECRALGARALVLPTDVADCL